MKVKTLENKITKILQKYNTNHFAKTEVKLGLSKPQRYWSQADREKTPFVLKITENVNYSDFNFPALLEIAKLFKTPNIDNIRERFSNKIDNDKICKCACNCRKDACTCYEQCHVDSRYLTVLEIRQAQIVVEDISQFQD